MPALLCQDERSLAFWMRAGALGPWVGLACRAGLYSKLQSKEGDLRDGFQKCGRSDKPADNTTEATTTHSQNPDRKFVTVYGPQTAGNETETNSGPQKVRDQKKSGSYTELQELKSQVWERQKSGDL